MSSGGSTTAHTTWFDRDALPARGAQKAVIRWAVVVRAAWLVVKLIVHTKVVLLVVLMRTGVCQ